METASEVRPEQAGNTAEFVALLRELKARSGLSYRQLEEAATRHGEVLARSTIADTLRREALPRPEVLAAFVRACGVDGDRLRAWLDARSRLALADDPAPGTAPPPPAEEPSPPPLEPAPPRAPGRRTAGRGRRRVSPLVLAGAALALLVLGGAVVWLVRGALTAPSTAGAVFPDGEVEIRPAGAPELCLTEGRERDGRYDSAVAVQRPCAEAVPPRTRLHGIGDGRHHIQWDHPEHGLGCLTALADGAAAGLFEPRDDCSGDHPDQRFRFEPLAGPDGAYRIRVGQGDRCVGIRDGERTAGAEAVQEPCADSAAQRFLVVPLDR
ncbi:XRE family transcriptional regulator [Allostreptomyces psammosilenae]|uniref:Transcriptional regulator with XRE-family HTH domain n=1 Tax=Allostreptomyces psammosilenae TaxID=1892865 RepID=A0A853A419_9ACTN|nr:XRE family transcriptional regulator [Allostreptomyces psammosilenae]NYI08210.1 transcriptional regulator with XRE-family HTH domain [Allostreptomyces psammosilenae]